MTRILALMDALIARKQLGMTDWHSLVGVLLIAMGGK